MSGSRLGRVVLAVNATAGRGRGGRAGAAAAGVLDRAGWEVDVIREADAAATGRRLRAALEDADPPAAVLAVGGDGMVNLAVNVLAETTTPLGIIPAGTGNDIARALGLPVQDPAAAARMAAEALVHGRARAIDAIRCRPPDDPDAPPLWFAGVLGAGFDALVNERANRWRYPRGRLRYDLAILRELPVLRPRDYEVDLDGELHRFRAVLVAVGNCRAYGGGMLVTPDAVPDDGLVDVLIVGPIGRLEFVRIYPRVYAGTHLSHPAVRVLRAKSVTIGSPGIVAYADGERLAPLPLRCEVVRGGLTVLPG